MSLPQVLAEKRIVITMGPGGVGKTSVAAALGLQAAVLGRRALVLTIDPALRLAEALGLSGVVPGDHQILSEQDLSLAGVPAKAPLTVTMLDTGRAWADVIAREVPSLEVRKRILGHPFFLRLSGNLAGSREYAAMEEVYHLNQVGAFDLLILDTPPTVHGFDFLEAPDKVLDVLEHEGHRWLLRPALAAGKLGLRMLDFSGSYVVRTIARFTGMDFLRELASFVDLFSSLLEGFRRRAATVKATLRSPATAFVLVTTADPGLAEETLYLHRRLCRQDLPPDTVLVNRVTPAPLPLPSATGWRADLLRRLREAQSPDTAAAADVLQAMEQAHLSLAQIAARDRACLETMERTLDPDSALLPVALLEQDIHDLGSLERMRAAMFGGAPGDKP